MARVHDRLSHRLATVLDCFSRKVVGWSLADGMRTDLIADARPMAAATRSGLAGAVFHSDHGAQYGSRAPTTPQRAGICRVRSLDPVAALLTGLTVRRHGQRALLRALTRAKRAPLAINVF
ncbi:DDE-type integrase/transposase/recombinase [Streptomyces sp. NPDC002144]